MRWAVTRLIATTLVVYLQQVKANLRSAELPEYVAV